MRTYEISSDLDEINYNNNRSTRSFKIAGSVATLYIQDPDPSRLTDTAPGKTVMVPLHFYNDGPSDSNTIIATYIPPTGVKGVDAGMPGICAVYRVYGSTGVRCQIQEIKAGGTYNISVPVKISSALPAGRYTGNVQTVWGSDHARTRQYFKANFTVVNSTSLNPTATTPTVVNTNVPTLGLQTNKPVPGIQPENPGIINNNAPGVQVKAYSFPTGLISVYDKSSTSFNDAKLINHPSRFEAVIGIPAGTGSSPFAIIIHGFMRNCIPYIHKENITVEWKEVCPRGFNYQRMAFNGVPIVDALARKGIASVAIDVSSSFWSHNNPNQYYRKNGQKIPPINEMNVLKTLIE